MGRTLVELGAIVGAAFTIWRYVIKPMGELVIRMANAVQRIEEANPAWVDEREEVLARIEKLEQDAGSR